jgi:3-methyladenine DNA glycosylase AlkD
VLTTAKSALEKLETLGDPKRAEVSIRFFKTGPGEYGEGDDFLGIRVPDLRKMSRELRETPLKELIDLLHSRFHEARLLALLGMVEQYKRGGEDVRGRLYQSYLENTRWINNWDLVDTSAEHIVGAHTWEKGREVLQSLAGSESMWERRIAILATFHFIKKGDYGDTLNLAERLLSDREDLIQKAVGWMLREVGNRDRVVLNDFLTHHYKTMPRTTLRYAVEKHSKDERLRYLG